MYGGARGNFMAKLKKADDFLKKSRLISHLGSALHQGGVPHAGRIAHFAQSHGYGRRPRVRRARRMQGGSFMDTLKKVNNFFKKTKLISTVGRALGTAGVPYASQIAGVAGNLGYGRRRRRTYRKKKVHAMHPEVIHAALMGHGLSLAGGRRRVTRRRRM